MAALAVAALARGARADPPGESAAASAAPAPPGQDGSTAAPAPAAAKPADKAKDSTWSGLDALPFIPVPEIDTAPYSGLTFGLIPVLLEQNAQGQIDQIIAPDIIYSQYFGWGARFRIFRNPSEDEKWSVVGGAKQSVEREFDADYENGLLRQSDWSWSAHASYDRSGTGRYYGLGNRSPLADQSSFIESVALADAVIGRNVTHALQLAYRLRAGSVAVEQSTLNSLPSIKAIFPDAPGLGDNSDLEQRLTLSYDTRDSVIVPHAGERIAAVAGYATRALGQSVSYSVLALDGTWFQPAGRDFTLVEHAALRYMPSYLGAPFWARSQIGGDRSVMGDEQPLRAYGPGRFIDRNSFAASVEARTWVKRFRLFDSDLALELAPFIDTGKVFADMEGSPLSQLHVGGGMGFRLVASPFVVGYLDVGFGREKFAVFSGIDYPF